MLSRPSPLWPIFLTLIALSVLWYIIYARRNGIDLGFGENTFPQSPNRVLRPGKTFWDILQLAGVPLVLAVIAYLFQYTTKRSEQRIALENQRNEILQRYVDSMSSLFLTEQWRNAVAEFRASKPPARTGAQTLARARTQLALDALGTHPPDQRRRGEIIRFLMESRVLQLEERIKPALIDLSGTNLSGADLARVDLSSVDLSGVDLTGADLRWVNLKEAVEDAPSKEHSYRRPRLYSTKLDPKWRLVHNIVNGRNREKNLRREDLRDAYLAGADLSGADLRWCRMRGAILTNARFDRADLRYANLENAVLSGADFLAAKMNLFTRLDRKWRTVWMLRNGIGDEKKRLERVRAADLAHACLRWSNLENVVFEGADLSNADFEGGWLDGAKFQSDTRLFDTVFKKAHLRGCEIQVSSAPGCKFEEAHMQKANLRNTSFLDAIFRGAELDEADLSGARFFLGKFVNAKLHGAKLRGTRFEKTDLDGADFEGADLAGAEFKAVDLRKAKLTQRQLDSANLLPGTVLPDGRTVS